jgi:hypothetical protein
MGRSNQAVKYPTWQPQCESALTEVDSDKLKAKIAAAEEAIFRRGLELKTNGNDPERRAMLQAARQLRALMVAVLGYPPVVGLESDRA